MQKKNHVKKWWTDSSSRSVQHPYVSMAFLTLFIFIRSKDAKTFKIHPSLVDHSRQVVDPQNCDSSVKKNPLHSYDFLQSLNVASLKPRCGPAPPLGDTGQTKLSCLLHDFCKNAFKQSKKKRKKDFLLKETM